jgi:hypothetical protein
MIIKWKLYTYIPNAILENGCNWGPSGNSLKDIEHAYKTDKGIYTLLGPTEMSTW